jgi:type III secretory pathway component EscV
LERGWWRKSRRWVISTAAGIIVTRVASEEEGGQLGRDIGLQIMAQPKAIAIAAGLLALLAIVPGLPTIPFLTLALILGALAWRLLRGPAAPAGATVATGALAATARAGAAPLTSDEASALSPVLTPVAVEVGAELGARLGPSGSGHGVFVAEIVPALALLDALERTHPTLVREVVPKLVPLVLMTDILRRLLEEGISLRNLRDILGARAEWAPHERDPVALTEHVRGALRRVITHRHAGDGGVLAAYLLDPMIEDTIRESVQKTPTGNYLALEPQLSHDIVAAVGRAVGPGGSAGAVLITGAEIRRYVRRLIETDHPDLAVLSFQELSPEAQIRPIARTSV